MRSSNPVRTTHLAVRLALWALVVAAILFCIAIVDRPLADFVASHPTRIRGLRFVIGAPELLLGLALVAPIIGWKQRRSPVGWDTIAASCSISIVWTAVVVELVLKRVFGRSGPTSWTGHQEFAFHWLRGRQAELQSMPSGEAAILSAFFAVLWVLLPRWRWLYIFIGSVEAIGLIGLNWHFVSDVIAGVAIGVVGAGAALRLTGRGLTSPSQRG